ncbi:SDR family NAD(P)-dependent oxidoreductase [Thalassotalea maritima]|uniref:SDR family NAD(P)-dependent oxidoreductase n=1 Tax=Thalassotalea maritima TaxID=3242416 RepID=UPI003527704E
MNITNQSLDNKVAIVTGAGQGIGKAIAKAFASLGCHVVCTARTLADIEATCDEINREFAGSQVDNATGHLAVPFQADVCHADDRQALVNFTLAKFNRITHLVNTVGGGGPCPFTKIDTNTLSNIFDLNVTTAAHLIQLCQVHMINSGGGNVINISSAAAKLVQQNFSAYAAVKAALDHFTRNIAQELAPEVRVNAISPGPIATKALMDVAPEAMLEQMAERTPMQRIGNVEDIANAACFFATDASSWITGQILAVDGGAEQPIFN